MRLPATLTLLVASVGLASCAQTAAGVLPRSTAARVVAPAASSFSVIANLACATSGYRPWAALTRYNGMLYGTGAGNCGRYGDGTVFAVNPSTAALRIVHGFSETAGDGANPHGGLCVLGGLLYGVTSAGGAHGAGTIFSLDPKTGGERVVHSFNGANEGADPRGTLIAVHGVLYGTAKFGGAEPRLAGTVFSVTPGGDFRVLHQFHGADGANPYAGLTYVDGTLYGTTAGGGGPSNGGVVFAIDGATHAERTVHAFRAHDSGAIDGRLPYGGVTAYGGRLYGATCGGGKKGRGALYEIDRATGIERLLHSFTAQEGVCPRGGLVAYNGTLYGTAVHGGTDYAGTVFALTPSSGAFRVVRELGHHGAQGAEPYGGLAVFQNLLYGTTRAGGTHRSGVVFSIRP